MTLAEKAALDDLAQHLYDFLPGKPHPYADARISFEGVARDLGLSDCWSGGSKRPAIRHLLGATIDGKRGLPSLIVKIVERALTYRKNKNPIVRGDIERLNHLLARVGYKIPDLHDVAFLERLPRAKGSESNDNAGSEDHQTLSVLEGRLLNLATLGAQERGYAFEGFLADLFAFHKLAPRSAFRLKGEQIDGSFHLRNEFYLVEAKWQSAPAGLAELLTFHGKIEGKAQWARGLFVSYSGFTEDGLHAFAQGRRTSIICMDGLDLAHILSGSIGFVDAIEHKARRAAETNRAFVSIRDLFVGVI